MAGSVNEVIPVGHPGRGRGGCFRGTAWADGRSATHEGALAPCGSGKGLAVPYSTAR